MSNITLQDFDAVVRMIDVVSARGAIRGNELTAVGTLREKFTSVLEEEIKKQQEAQGGAPAAPSVPSVYEDGGAAYEDGGVVDLERTDDTLTLN